MVCQGALEALVTVVITGKVGFSALGTDPRSPMMNVTTGDTMTLSFTVSPQATVREVPLQGIVMDGIAPFEMCTGDFALTFSSGLHFHLGPPPVAIDGTVGSFYYSLMKSRPVLDGAWVSTAPDMGQKGLPLELHGAPPKEIYTGVFELRYDRNTIPSLDIAKSFGTYSGRLPAPPRSPPPPPPPPRCPEHRSRVASSRQKRPPPACSPRPAHLLVHSQGSALGGAEDYARLGCERGAHGGPRDHDHQARLPS